MNVGRLDYDVAPGSKAAEEIPHAAAPDQPQCSLPCRRIAGSFDDSIWAALIFGVIADGFHHIWSVVNIDNSVSAQPARDIERGISTGKGNHANTAAR